MVILQGCIELVRLGFCECVGFEVDEEILKLASHIRTFEYECSRAKSVPPDDDVQRRHRPAPKFMKLADVQMLLKH